MKKWQIVKKFRIKNSELRIEEVIKILLDNRGVHTKKQVEEFLYPTLPQNLTLREVGIDSKLLKSAISRIGNAIRNKESIVVYADYDADGICAGAMMWETLYALTKNVMPYIPHRVEEGYGLSTKGIDAVRDQFHPTLIITVDHGITAWEKVEYAKKFGIDVIVTDHHVKPKKLPDCPIVHTTELSGAGVSWFVAHQLLIQHTNLGITHPVSLIQHTDDLLAIAAIGTIADMVPLVGANRSIAKYGLQALTKTKRVGLQALIAQAGLTGIPIGAYEVSHILAPRLNAMGRIVHAMDALRLLCIKDKAKAEELALKLGLTNKERQQLTLETALHARELLPKSSKLLKKLIFISHESYNQGVIGLVAGKLVEEYYRPSIVVSRGEIYSKASARSVNGFNIVEAIRSCSDLLVDVGGHPMAAGFTIETKNLTALQKRLEDLAENQLNEDLLTRVLRVDLELPLEAVTPDLWQKVQELAPFGLGNPEPVFATKHVNVEDARLVGVDGKHLKLRVSCPMPALSEAEVSHVSFDAIAFGMGELNNNLKQGQSIDIAYTIDMNEWNGNKRIQLKIKDIC